MPRVYIKQDWSQRMLKHVQREGECLIWTAMMQNDCPWIAYQIDNKGQGSRYTSVRALLAKKLNLIDSRHRAIISTSCGDIRCVEWTHFVMADSAPSVRNIEIASKYWARVGALRELRYTLNALAEEYGLTRERVRQIAMRCKKHVGAEELERVGYGNTMSKLSDKMESA